MLPWKAEADENFLPCICASSELIFVFPIKNDFYINCLEQQGIEKLAQSLPRTKDDIGVTCLPLQKTLFIKCKGKAGKLLTLPCSPAQAALQQLFDPLQFLHFPPRPPEVNFTAAQATAFN